MSDSIVIATAERIFADLADPRTINSDKDGHWRQPLWKALADSGMPLSWVPDHLGGAGLSLADGFGVVHAAGRFALAVPLAETMLAGWLLAQSEISSPPGMMTCAPANPTERIICDGGRLSGRARRVPFANASDHIAVTAWDGDALMIALVETKNCRINTGRSLGYDSSDTVKFDQTEAIDIKPAPQGFDSHAPMLMGAVLRSLQIAGALQTILDMTVTYANERIAFEKPIAKFQAIQHQLAKLAGEVAAATAAATSAADTIANSTTFGDAEFLEAASAKIRCAEASEKGCAIAHQVHGAIGFSMEHVLHRYTLRALAWRDDFGNESWWATELGKFAALRGAHELWPLVASR